jgi:LL-diaminopimelate aminotransferase
MAFVNENYLKLQAGYLFPEIARRMESFCKANPQSAKRVIRCGIGDVTEPLPPACIQAMHTAADELGNRDTFRGYPPPTGYEFLRDAIAKTDFADRGPDISADEIFVSDGSKGDCGAALDIFGDGNAIGITDPVYPVYVDTNVMVGNTGPARADGSYEGFVYLPGNAANGFVPDLPREKLDIIYLCYPNNPTGAMITRSQLEQWVTYALANNSVILYDVAYQAYIRESGLPRSIYESPGARKCAMEFHSFSKDGGFTGVRCGYTVCPKDLFALTRDGKKIALHGLWSRRWSTKSNGVSYPVQRAAEALYSPEGRAQIKTLIDHYMTNAKILRQGCEAMGMQVFGGVNAPYVWVACPDGLNSWQMFDRMLQEANVVITPGVGFGRCGEGWFRISAFNSRENVEEVVKRMKAMVMQPA